MKIKLNPYWFDLLRHFEDKGYIHNGLTIPFLIGSRKVLEPQESLLSIKDFIISINEVGGTILECPDIGEFVFGTLDQETLIYKSAYPKTIDNIIITDNSLHSVNSLQEVISHFELRYQKNLDSGEYSKNYGVWGGFSEIEFKRIEEINYR